MLKLVLEGCNGEIVRAIEHCLAVDDTRATSRRSISSSDASSSATTTTTSTETASSAASVTPTSPAEFFRNLTAPQRVLPTFPHYMVGLPFFYIYSMFDIASAVAHSSLPISWIGWSKCITATGSSSHLNYISNHCSIVKKRHNEN